MKHRRKARCRTEPCPALLAKTSTYVPMAGLILTLDIATGQFLQFSILFVILVGMATAWYCQAPIAYGKSNLRDPKTT
jgi:hypothetical protein